MARGEVPRRRRERSHFCGRLLDSGIRLGPCRTRPRLHSAIALARREATLARKGATFPEEQKSAVTAAAEGSWTALKGEADGREDAREYLAYKLYEPLLGNLSKPVIAQYMAALMVSGTMEEVVPSIPPYIKRAIAYVTGNDTAEGPAGQVTNNQGIVAP